MSNVEIKTKFIEGKNLFPGKLLIRRDNRIASYTLTGIYEDNSSEDTIKK